MDITDTDFLQANRQGAARQAACPAAVAVRYDQRIERVVVTLASKLEIAFAPGDVQALAHAAPASLAEAQISPSGPGIHFPCSTPTCTCQPCWKASWVRSAGWQATTARKAARRAAAPSPRPRAKTASSVAVRAR